MIKELEQFVTLQNEKRALKARLADIEIDLKMAQQSAMAWMDQHNVDSIRTADSTVYRRRALRASARVPGPDGAALLLASGFADCITMNIAALKARARDDMRADGTDNDWEFAPDRVPDVIRECVDFTELSTIESRNT